MITSGGTEGVGLSTTVTVVTVSIVILISDFFLTKFFLAVLIQVCHSRVGGNPEEYSKDTGFLLSQE